MIRFLDDYGVLVSVFCSFLFLIIGWYVLLNSTKYITSRNEARSTLDDLNKLLDDSAENSVEFWANYSKKTATQKRAFFKNGSAVADQVRRYKELLSLYGLQVMQGSEVKQIKDLLTLDASKKERDELDTFLQSKEFKTNTLFNKVIIDNNYIFIKQHKPIDIPLLDSIKKRLPEITPAILGVVFGCILMALYFFIGSKIYPLN
ncbi:hypothetical protein AB6D90_13985 [Vibrio splendidus]